MRKCVRVCVSACYKYSHDACVHEYVQVRQCAYACASAYAYACASAYGVESVVKGFRSGVASGRVCIVAM